MAQIEQGSAARIASTGRIRWQQHDAPFDLATLEKGVRAVRLLECKDDVDDDGNT